MRLAVADVGGVLPCGRILVVMRADAGVRVEVQSATGEERWAQAVVGGVMQAEEIKAGLDRVASLRARAERIGLERCPLSTMIGVEPQAIVAREQRQAMGQRGLFFRR